MQKLKKDFFSYDSEIVAKNLLGKIIKVGEKKGVIYEVEAYKGLCDKASHAYPKQTFRNTLMYESYGKIYVYLIYGMHFCLNFTSDSTKHGAVLIRAIKDIKTGKDYDGPGKLTKFLEINRDFNGESLENGKKLCIFDNNIKLKDIKATSRIGIKKALDKKWRFIGKIKNV